MALASTSVPMVEGTLKNGCCQCLCPQGELYLLPVSPGDFPSSAGRSDPGSFQITASAWGPGACEILCAPFKSSVSLDLPEVSPTSLQSQMFWGLIFVVHPCVGEPDVGLRPLAPWGKPLQL